MPLSIQVFTGSPTPIFRQIVEQVCIAISTGRLAEGEAMPSIRNVAEELAINPNTVARAYSDLARDGVIESRGTVGYFVAPRRQLYTRPERRRRIEPTLRAYLSEAFILGFTPEEVFEQIQDEIEELSPKGSNRPKGS
jgi:GntR family transcriptional regulator